MNIKQQMEYIKNTQRYGRPWYFNVAKKLIKDVQRKKGEYVSPLHVAIDKRGDNEVVLCLDTVSTRNNRVYKNYGSLSLCELEKHYMNDIHAYEVLVADEPVKMYYDIDIKRSEGEEKNNEILSLVKKLIINEGIYEKDILIFAGSGEHEGGIKQSYHIIVNDKFWKNMTEFRMFLNYLEHTIYTNEDYVLLRNGILDFNVYKKNGLFKLPFQTKGGKNVKQTPITGECSLTDMLVGHYNDLPIDYYSTLKYREFSNTNIRTVKCANNTKVRVSFALGNIIQILSNAFPKGYKLNLEGEVSNDYKYYLNSIPNNSNVPRIVWKVIGYCISTITQNSEEGLREWVKWSLPYDNTTTATSIKDEYMSHSVNKGYGYKTLYTLAKIFNPKITNPPSSMDYLFDDEAPFNVEQKIINSRYIECDDFNMEATLKNNDIVFIKSPMGTGKSWTLKQIFGKYKSILYLSCKRAFASAMTQEFKENGFINYDDMKNKGDIIDCDKIICSVESIQYCRNYYDLVIIDESESIADNLTGAMFKKNNPIEGAMTMYDIIYNSHKHLVMDAFISQRSFKFISDILDTKSKSIYYLKNEYKYKRRVFHEYTMKESFINAIKTDLEEKKRVVVVSASKTLLLQIINDCKSYNIKYYHSNEKLDLDCKVNEEWKDCDLLIYTPTITAGISYDNNDYLFDKLYIYSVNKGSTHFRNIIQAHKRVRHFNDNIIGVLLSAGYKFNDQHTPIKMDEIEALEYKHKATLFGEETKILAECDKMEYIYQIYLHNKLEENISQVQHKDFAYRYMKEENIINEKNENENYEFLPPFVEKIHYKKIPKISRDIRNDYTDIMNTGGTISDDDRMKVLKYNYDNCYVASNIEPVITEEAFERFYKSKHHQKFNNVRELKTLVHRGVYEDKDIMNTMLEKDKINPLEFKSEKYKAFEIVAKFFRNLGVMNEFNINPLQEFNSSDFNKCLVFLKPYSVKGINTLLKDNYINIKKSDAGLTTRNIHTIFNCLLKEYFGMEVKTLGDKWIRIEGKKKKLKKFNINNYKPPKPVNGDEADWVEYAEAIKFSNDKYNQILLMNDNPCIENDKSLVVEDMDFMDEEPVKKKKTIKLKVKKSKTNKPKCPSCGKGYTGFTVKCVACMREDF